MSSNEERSQKCNRLGCPKEATRHSQVDIGFGLKADVWGCEEHHDEIVKSLIPEKETGKK